MQSIGNFTWDDGVDVGADQFILTRILMSFGIHSYNFGYYTGLALLQSNDGMFVHVTMGADGVVRCNIDFNSFNNDGSSVDERFIQLSFPMADPKFDPARIGPNVMMRMNAISMSGVGSL